MDNKNNSTTDLFRILSNSDSIDVFLDEYDSVLEKPTFSAYINKLIEEKNCSIPEIIERSCMSQSYCYQLIKGIRKPSRDKIIQLGIGIELNLNEINKLLRVGGKSELYCRDKRDAIVIFGINNNLAVMDIEELLYERNLQSFMDYL